MEYLRLPKPNVFFADTAPSSYPKKQYLVLTTAYRPSTVCVYATMPYEIIDGDKHFCGMDCMVSWIVKGSHREWLERQIMEKEEQ